MCPNSAATGRPFRTRPFAKRKSRCLARAVSHGSSDSDPNLLDILAIAYAAAGQFTRAAEVEQKALNLTAEDRPEERVKREGLLKSFRQGKPVRDASLK